MIGSNFQSDYFLLTYPLSICFLLCKQFIFRMVDGDNNEWSRFF